jgi:hypothetical protein
VNAWESAAWQLYRRGWSCESISAWLAVQDWEVAIGTVREFCEGYAGRRANELAERRMREQRALASGDVAALFPD